jgi:hypothetical protein
MGRIVVLIFLIAAIPWAIATWWQIRRSQSARERAWVARASLSTWLFSLLGAMAFVFLSMRGQFLALPLVVAAGLGVRYGLRKTRARIREQEGDPFSRAKPLN